MKKVWLVGLVLVGWLLMGGRVLGQQNYTGACTSNFTNYFTCEVNTTAGDSQGAPWTIAPTGDFCNASEGYTADTTICSGYWPSRQLCVLEGEEYGEMTCCLPCSQDEVEQTATLQWGDACSVDGEESCQTPLECRANRCLYPSFTIYHTQPCLDSSECRDGTSEIANADLVCRYSDSGTEFGTCELDTLFYCTNDQECVDHTGNPDALCDHGTCLFTTPETIEQDAIPQSQVTFDYCRQVPGVFNDPSTQRGQCHICMEKYGEGKAVFTAVGCVQVSGSNLAADLIKLMLGIAGGATLLSILAAAFLLTISQGDSNKVKEAKSMVTAAVSGLLFLIFSVIILNFIGVDILAIPGLG